MSKFIENHPLAIEVWLFYRREKEAIGEKLNKKLWDLIGKDDELTRLFDKMTMEDEETKRKEIRQLVAKNQANLRICILSDVMDKKSIDESYKAISEMILSIDYQDFEFWFNRFSSGNWNLDQKTFYDLPMEVVENIVEELNFPSQMRLRRVSNGLRNIVDQGKPSIDEIHYSIYYEGSQNNLYLSIYKFNGPKSDRSWERLYHGEDNLKIAFDRLETLLNNPRLRLKRFIWDNIFSTDINEKFLDMVNSLNHKLEIVELEASLNGDSMIDLLKAVKPGTLEEIKFGGKFEPIHIDQLAQLDQWKKAETVFSERYF
uniref:F-box domain-containing protein n=1 Tax=Caenorhabditis tropicalis TaxID=1561998 RepID=A0A1I7UI89_9PELO